MPPTAGRSSDACSSTPRRAVVWATLHDPALTGVLFPELKLGPAAPAWPAAATTRSARARLGLLRDAARVESLEARPEARFRLRVTASGFDSEWSWRLEPVAGGTRVIHGATFEPFDRWTGILVRLGRASLASRVESHLRALKERAEAAQRGRIPAERSVVAGRPPQRPRAGDAAPARTVRAWIPGSSRSSPSRRSCTWPGTSGSRPPATRSGPRRSGCSPAASGSCPSASPSGGSAGSRRCRSEGIALGLASGVVEAAYFILLAAAYRRGDLSVVYPVARGTAPLLAVAIGVGLFGERLGVAGSIGVVALLAGFLLLQRPWRAIALARQWRRGRPEGRGDSAILFALATGVMIATYTAIDRIGTREIDVFTYAAILWLTCSVVLVAWVAIVAGGDLLRYGPEASRRAAVGGILTLAAYLCILVALSVAPLSGVAPLRESATVFAAAWGSVRMGEAGDPREAVRRIGASVLIVGGALLLAVGGGWSGRRPAPGRLRPARPWR